MSTQLATTPLDAWHRRAGGKMVPFAGFEMPIQYSSIISEHQACRSSAALFDVSHMGRIRFDGEGSEQLLDHLLTRRVIGMPVGQVRYALMCNADGGVLDDVLVSHVETPSQSRYHLLVVNASNRDKIIKWIQPHLADFPTVTVSDRTELTAMIAVQGPKAITVCKRLFKFDPARLKYYRAAVTEQFGKPVIISRTGYTGEDGFELIVRAEEAERIWENVLLAGREQGFAAAGLGARDTLRLEAGMPLYGHELTSRSIQSLPVCRSHATWRIDPLSAINHCGRLPRRVRSACASDCCPRANGPHGKGVQCLTSMVKTSVSSPAADRHRRWGIRSRWHTLLPPLRRIVNFKLIFVARQWEHARQPCRFTNEPGRNRKES